MKNRRMIVIAAVAAAGVAGIGVAVWRLHVNQQPRLVYTSAGYGGYVPEPIRRPNRPKPGPLEAARSAYVAGNYRDAEARALTYVQSVSRTAAPAERAKVAGADLILAYSAARRKDMKLARRRFATLRQEAANLPSGESQNVESRSEDPAIEAEAAYEHAVCTAALGDKAGAEREYVAFIKAYPDSPFVQGAIDRIGRMHGGKVPESAEAVWQEAQRAYVDHEKQNRREAAMCGPLCMAEFLRMNGVAADSQALADEMGTSDRGTGLRSLIAAATKRGFAARGLMLTWKGLQKQPLPLIALIRPGHYVLLESLSWYSVTYWDPDAGAVAHLGKVTCAPADFQKEWGGVALILTPQRKAPTGSAAS